jgi:hypothetical protein
MDTHQLLQPIMDTHRLRHQSLIMDTHQLRSIMDTHRLRHQSLIMDNQSWTPINYGSNNQSWTTNHGHPSITTTNHGHP